MTGSPYRAFFHSHSTPSHQHLQASRASSGRRTAKALSMELETVPIVSGMVDSPSNRSPSNALRLMSPANRFRAAPSKRSSPHRLRSAGRLRWSHQHVARNACPLITHACFVLGFAFCCRVLSRVSQVPILSASFWHYLHFLVQSARIFFACGGQQHSIFLSNFLYTEGRAHLSHERPPGSTPGRWLTCVVRISHLHTAWLLTGTQGDLGRSVNCLTLSVVAALLLWY